MTSATHCDVSRGPLLHGRSFTRHPPAGHGPVVGAAHPGGMRVLLVTESFYPAGHPSADGTTTTLKAVVDRLVDTGHEVRVVAPAPGLPCYRRSDVVRVSPLAKPGAQVRAALDAFRPDVVLAATPSTGPGSLGRKALKHARRVGVPTVVVQQAPVPDVLWDYWRTTVADRADRLLVTAPWLAARFAALGVAATTWEPGVDTLAFSPALRDEWLHRHWSRASSRPRPQVVVGYVGSLHKRQGVRRLAALADLPGTRLVVVGDGPQRDWLADRLPGARFTGPLATGDLTVAVATLDVLVHPGEEQVCCHALREAGASGVPVVAPRAGGARDVVRHLETGLLHEPSDEQDLVRAVASLAADEQRSLMGAHARELAGRRSWTAAADELLDVLTQVAPAVGQRVRVP